MRNYNSKILRNANLNNELNATTLKRHAIIGLKWLDPNSFTAKHGQS